MASKFRAMGVFLCLTISLTTKKASLSRRACQGQQMAWISIFAKILDAPTSANQPTAPGRVPRSRERAAARSMASLHTARTCLPCNANAVDSGPCRKVIVGLPRSIGESLLISKQSCTVARILSVRILAKMSALDPLTITAGALLSLAPRDTRARFAGPASRFQTTPPHDSA